MLFNSVQDIGTIESYLLKHIVEKCSNCGMASVEMTLFFRLKYFHFVDASSLENFVFY